MADFSGAPRPPYQSLNAVTATSTGGVEDLGAVFASSVLQSIVTGAPATVSLVLEGSEDSVNWFTLATSTSTTGDTQTGSVPARFLRARLATLTGGTSPTVTAWVGGAQGGGGSGGTSSSVKVLDSGGVNTATVSAAGAVKVDGSAVTQPVSLATNSPDVTDRAGRLVGIVYGTQGQVTQKAASTAAVAADTSVVVALSPNSPIPTGANTIGALTANQSVNQAQVAGTATDTNSGVKSAGTQRVVLATDQPQLTNALKVDGSAVTQPVSGTVTANVGTSGSLALDATLTGGTQRAGYSSSATGTITSVNGSATSVTVLASNTARKGAAFYNDSSAILYLAVTSAAASTTAYTVQIPANGYYELPSVGFVYTGAITGIWSSATGAVRVTELS